MTTITRESRSGIGRFRLAGVAFIALIGGVLIAVRLLYVFYPPPADLFEEMTALRTELTGPMRSQDRDANLDYVGRMRELARKLPVSAVIRQGHLTPEQRTCGDELMESLDALREKYCRRASG